MNIAVPETALATAFMRIILCIDSTGNWSDWSRHKKAQEFVMLDSCQPVPVARAYIHLVPGNSMLGSCEAGVFRKQPGRYASL
jgi:hypothetical protein